jgi:predicted house-cleaning NTP pyrophosphatase (Maf/HAM1 superfamily)
MKDVVERLIESKKVKSEVLIFCDTIIVHEGEIIEKPRDKTHLIQIL